MCTELKGPFHLSVRSRGITIEEALVLIIRSHTPDHTITVEGNFISIVHKKDDEHIRMQLPEHVCVRIEKLLANLKPHARNTRVRANEANYPETAEAFAVAWGATRANERKRAKMLSVRRLALIIGLIERDNLTFSQANKRTEAPNYFEVMRDVDH